MGNSIILPGDNHILFRSAPDIKDICKPLIEHLHITEFTYERIYNDNTKIKLTNQPEWLSFFYNNNFHLLGDDFLDQLKPGAHFTSILKTPETDQVFEACLAYKIGYGVLIIDFFDDYRELYWFTSSINQNSVDYVSKIDLLKIFTKFFKEKASHLIQKAEYEKILRPNPTRIFQSSDSEQLFLKAVQTKKYSFNYKNLNVVFSKKELACAIGLLRGKSAKEIAKSLCRSPRTIESHIENIKAKLNCDIKSQLIDMLFNLDINIFSNKLP